MRLYPAITKDEALSMLTAQATAAWGAEVAATMGNQLRSLGEAMAAVSEVDVEPEVEPLFFTTSAPA